MEFEIPQISIVSASEKVKLIAEAKLNSVKPFKSRIFKELIGQINEGNLYCNFSTSLDEHEAANTDIMQFARDFYTINHAEFEPLISLGYKYICRSLLSKLEFRVCINIFVCEEDYDKFTTECFSKILSLIKNTYVNVHSPLKIRKSFISQDFLINVSRDSLIYCLNNLNSSTSFGDYELTDDSEYYIISRK
jgi:hypothetical protein